MSAERTGSAPFLTLEDPNAKISGSRDPLGMVPIWLAFARHLITNVVLRMEQAAAYARHVGHKVDDDIRGIERVKRFVSEGRGKVPIQTRDLLAAEHRAFFRVRRKQAEALDALLARLPELRAKLPTDRMDGGQAFIEWYEEAFLKPVAPEAVEA